MNGMQLRNVLTTYFNESELRDLCFDLDIDYERLEGDEKSSKARELIMYCERHDRVAELVEVCRKLRSHVFDQEAPPGTPPDTWPLGSDERTTPSERGKLGDVIKATVIGPISGQVAIGTDITQIHTADAAGAERQQPTEQGACGSQVSQAPL